MATPLSIVYVCVWTWYRLWMEAISAKNMAAHKVRHKMSRMGNEIG